MTKTLTSRTGCWTCREEGYKCDEQKPFCSRCVRFGKMCKGYSVRLRWHRIHSSNIRSNTPVDNTTQPKIPLSSSSTRILDIKPGDQELLHHWQTTLADIISISAGANNPFLVHLTPLLAHSCALRSVITSMAASHLAVLRPDSDLFLLAIEHRLRAVSSLRENIANTPPEISLATIIYYHKLPRELLRQTPKSIIWTGLKHSSARKAVKRPGPRQQHNFSSACVRTMTFFHQCLRVVHLFLT